MDDILYVDFLFGSKRKYFNLNLISYTPIEVGGKPWSDTFNIKIDEYFFKFWEWVRDNYEVNATVQKVVSFKEIVPTQAVIERKTRGIDKDKGYAWIHKLSVSDDNQTEEIIFYPFTCDLKSNILDEL